MTISGRWLAVAILVLGGAASVRAAEGPASVKMTDFVAPDFFFAAVVHPSRIVQSPAGQAVWSGGAPHSPASAELAVLQTIPPQKIRRIVVLGRAGGFGMIWQFEDDFDLGRLLSDASIKTEPVTVAGKACLKLPPAPKNPEPLVAYVASARLVVFAPEATLQKMLAPSSEPRTLLEQLRQADLKHDVVLELQAAPLIRMLSEMAQSMQGAAGQPAMNPQAAAALSRFAQFKETLQEVKSVSGQIDLQGATLFQVTIAGANPQSPDKLFDTINPLKTQMQMMAAQTPAGQTLPTGVQLGMAICTSLEVQKQAKGVVLRAPMPANFAELLPKAIAEGPPGMAPGSPAERPTGTPGN